MKKIIALLLAAMMLLSLCGCESMVGMVNEAIDEIGSAYDDAYALPEGEIGDAWDDDGLLIDQDGWYYSAEEVSLYIDTYGCLPENFITKAEARELGWEGGSVEVYAPGYAIGGDVFGNREGYLPEAEGRVYYECDIDTDGTDSRGSKRIVFSNDGLIYYTEDHYVSFTLLYGEE